MIVAAVAVARVAADTAGTDQGPSMTESSDHEDHGDLRAALDAALTEVSAAEESLELALRELRAGIRAEKVTVTAAVEAAFVRLRKAHAAVADARARIGDAS
jgi:hypothetical protein